MEDHAVVVALAGKLDEVGGCLRRAGLVLSSISMAPLSVSIVALVMRVSSLESRRLSAALDPRRLAWLVRTRDLPDGFKLWRGDEPCW
jgi:hypothetical protein